MSMLNIPEPALVPVNSFAQRVILENEDFLRSSIVPAGLGVIRPRDQLVVVGQLGHPGASQQPNQIQNEGPLRTYWSHGGINE